MAGKYKLQDISKLDGRKIFVDANVLIYLFWPTGVFSWENNYASAFAQLLKQKNQMSVDFYVLSEVINRMIRTEHKKQQPNVHYKDFRNSTEGQDALTDIYLVVKESILTQFNMIGKLYEKNELENFLVVDELDFIDKSTVSICQENNLILFTNDRDFKNTDIEVLTGNPLIFTP